MKFVFLAMMVVFVTCEAWTQNLWSQAQIDQAFEHMTYHPADAGPLLESWGVTVHDFGLDLLAQGRGQEALLWTEISVANTYDAGTARAWALGALGLEDEAFALLDQIINQDSMIERARAFYILSLLSLRRGDFDQALVAATYGKETYEILGRTFGVAACQTIQNRLIGKMKSLGAPVIIGDPPPRSSYGL